MSKPAKTVLATSTCGLAIVLLSFGSAEFQPDGLAMLKNLRQLETLSFYMCEGINDEGIQHLANLTGLKYLRIYSERRPPKPQLCVTDAGLAHLEKLVKLETLDLFGHDLSDASLSVLTGDRIARASAERPRFHRCGPRRPGATPQTPHPPSLWNRSDCERRCGIEKSATRTPDRNWGPPGSQVTRWFARFFKAKSVTRKNRAAASVRSGKTLFWGQFVRCRLS